MDEQVRAALLRSQQASPAQLDAWQADAEATRQPLYAVVIEEGGVPEAALVTALSELLGVPSVALDAFEGKPELQTVLPSEVLYRLRALPIGLKPRDGVPTLFVAMTDPLDVDALEELAANTTHPVVALLAGASDLTRALERAVPREPLGFAAPSRAMPQRATRQAPPMPLALDADDSGMFTHEDAQSGFSLADSVAEVSAAYDAAPADEPLFEAFGGELPHARASDMHSALSLLDDIPRNRHSVDTSPSGFVSIPELSDSDLPGVKESGGYPTTGTSSGLGLDDSRFRLEDSRFSLEGSSGASSTIDGRTGMGLPNAGVPTLRAADPRGDDRVDWQRVPPDQLIHGLVRLLLRRGLITPAELADVLDELGSSS